jgi:threonine synthase
MFAGHTAEAQELMRADRYMWPWEWVGETAATGIIDDVAYDWKTVVAPMIDSGGWPIVVSEDQVVEANRLGREHTGIDVDATGTAGLAGLLEPITRATVASDDLVVVLFTGVRRA